MNNGEQSLASGAVPAETGTAGVSSEDNKSENHDEPGRQSARGLPWAATWVILLCVAALANGGLVYASGGKRGFFIACLATAACVLAAFFDAFTLRIPNPITYTAILAGLALNALPPVLTLIRADAVVVWLGAAGWQESLLGFLACAILGLAGRVLAGVHGGDLKLLAAMGAMLGLSLTAQALILALAMAIAYAILNLALVGRLNRILQIGAHRALEVLFLRKLHTPLPEDEVTPMSHIPMAIPMALGMAAVLYVQVRDGRGMLW